MHVGVRSSQHHINATQLYANLGEQHCRVLPGLHAFTGCDYKPAFYGKGKIKAWKILKKSLETQKAFGGLGESVVDPAAYEVLEEFVCSIYNIRSVKFKPNPTMMRKRSGTVTSEKMNLTMMFIFQTLTSATITIATIKFKRLFILYYLSF